MNENVDSTTRDTKQGGIPRWVSWVAALVVIFLLGFVPMWWQYRQANRG